MNAPPIRSTAARLTGWAALCLAGCLSGIVTAGAQPPAPIAARPPAFDANTGITVSNGGLNAPLADMEKYLAFLLGDDRKRGVYEGVLKRASLEEMFVARLPRTDREKTRAFDETLRTYLLRNVFPALAK